MKPPHILERLAVCSWSLRPKNPKDLARKLRETGINRVQLALDPLRTSPKTWSETEKIFRESGVAVVSGMVGCIGEDYSTLDSIRRTGGIAPDATWKQNVKNMSACATIAQKMGLKLVTFHAGFLPPDESHPSFGKMLQRLEVVADIFMAQNMLLGLETGQETAPELAAFLHRLNHPNIGVNFDPANMILYDKGDPIAALRVLGPWLKQCHIKDATRTRTPGTWGEEVVVGTGEVDWRAFFHAAKELNFHGNFAIEREAGEQRVNDIRSARNYIIALKT